MCSTDPLSRDFDQTPYIHNMRFNRGSNVMDVFTIAIPCCYTCIYCQYSVELCIKEYKLLMDFFHL